ncbi:MAG: hypothetical protein PX483_01235 [Nostocales cyanobacterium LE14-WE4]|jgi:hypothetical protein|uniref:hypothetical protein n=1 Tax=Anabaena sp. AL09 TaxID=1710891 RepID=UPI00080061EF|nr:hypothetical protein [Anabaena sp. AL09]MCE2696731.1 hypothetical protein [Anabaena sp. 49633_E8]MDJ0499487.1 hypothetical protein [Nostocales cyanobacterium LE14-WE4]OBQ09713.1 MAG: hypothetical protein AN482_10505 [Anabaena sp. LE011-02]QSV53355.1 MAG: hypothetical protein HEP80_05010 [Dolichospermum sp. UKL201]MCE2700981.1 hypothetical protein [Anabaena sp. 49633_E8]
MSHQNIKSDLLIELSADQQQLLSGGQQNNNQRPIICYRYAPFEDNSSGGRGRKRNVNVDVNIERGRQQRF